MIAGILGVAGGILSLVGDNIEDPVATDPNPAVILNARLGAAFGGVKNAVEQILIDAFETGDLSKWPAELTTGFYDELLPNFFDFGRYYWPLGGSEQRDLWNSITTKMKQNLVGILMVADNYYILKGAYHTNDCGRPGQLVDGNSCYSVEAPGHGYNHQHVAVHNDFSLPISQEVVANLTSFGVNIAELIRSSEACQTQNTDYGGTVKNDFQALSQPGPPPPCWYALPVLSVAGPDDEHAGYTTTPCDIVFASQTNPTPKNVGQNYLPDNLDKIFKSVDSGCCAAEC